MTAPVPFSAEELLAESSWLRRLAGTLVAGDAAAEDLVQETWLAALRHPPETGGSPRPWLARIARNLASNFRRSEARRKGHEAAALPPEPELDPAALTAAVDAQRVLAEAVLALDEELRTVVVLRYLLGQDSRAIGRQLGIPDGTVRWRLKRALELLRAELDRRHGGERQVWCVAFTALLPRAPAHSLAPTGAGLTEVLLMSTSTKLALSAAAVLAGLFATWVFTRSEDSVASVAASDDATLAVVERPSQPLADVERAPAQIEREAVPPAEHALIEPELAACCVVGRVLDPDGRGLPGARVLARAPRLGGLRAQLADGAEEPLATTSGADGVFSLALPDARPFVLSASHADFAPSPCALVFAGERRDLALAAGSRLVVSVRTSARAPCAGADVSVRIAAPDSSGALWTGAGKTGTDGTIAFAGLPAGNAGVEARHGTELGQRRVDTDGRSEARCEVPLDATGRITGTVRDRETGQPIAGARVGHRSAEVPEVTTDARGSYELTGIGLGTGLWSLGAHARGYTTYFQFLNVPPEAPERTLDIALDPAARVAGRVVDRARRPVPGARLVFLATVPFEPYTAETDRVEAVTDAAGRFELAELRPSVVHRVLVRAPDHGTGVFALGPFTPGVHAEEEELVLDAAGALSGTVPPEYVARACAVRLAWAGEEPAELDTLLETTRADPSGRFVFAGLAPGRYRLALVDPDAKSRYASTSELAEVRVELAPGEERRGVTFHLGDGTVAGTVRGPSGRAAQACRVSMRSLSAPEHELAATTTDSNGRFRLQVEDPGPFRLVVDDRALLLEMRTVAPVEVGSVDLVIELGEFRSPFAIRGRLVPETGALPEDVYVGFRDASGERLQRVGIPEADGAFTMRNLRDESYTVDLVDMANRFAPVRIDGVRPGDEEIVLRLRARE